MKGKTTSEIYSEEFENEDTSAVIIKTPGNTSDISFPEEYNIPEKETKTWCSYMEREFRASRSIISTQAGTDTPAGFIGREKSDDKLQQDELIK